MSLTRSRNLRASDQAVAGCSRCCTANPKAAMSTVLACMRVLPARAMGPTARFNFRIFSFASTRRERSAAAINSSSGLQ